MRKGPKTVGRPSKCAKACRVVLWSLVVAAGAWASATAANPEPNRRGRERLGIDPDVLFAWALGQLIYDVPDDAQGTQSAMRGHSLARTLYGFNDQVLNAAQPFNGTGRLHFTHSPDSGVIAGADDYRLLNYQAFDGDRLRDPERLGTRESTRESRAPFTGGFNPPYTYPDVNGLLLAALRSDGTLITPSFHRDWVFGPLDRANPNWTAPQGKYLLLRPRPAEMGPGFPLPPDPGADRSHQGDVKNLPSLPGGNDSIWIDLGFPVRTAADGRKFKPLFAFLVVDLDNPAGSQRGRDRPVTFAGWGPWETAITPWLWDRARESFYAVPGGDPEVPPRGPEVRFPDFSRRGLPVPPFSDLRIPGRPPYDPEADWRGFRSLSLVAQGVGRAQPPPDDGAALNRLAALERVDLNRRLPPYPQEVPFVTPEQLELVKSAQTGRRRLAEELYRQLLLVTGVGPIPAVAIQDPPDEDLAALRWLAQLAVNIVDYIDEDDYSTSFNFYSPLLDGLPLSDVGRSTETPAGEQVPRYWVFGTELPSVVLNEVMTELTAATGPPSVRVWAELYRPVFDIPPPDPLRPPDANPVPLFVPSGSGGYSPYRVVIANTNAGRTPLFDHPDNVLGAPDQVHGAADFGATLGTVGNPGRTVPASFGPHPYLIVGPSSEGGQDAKRTIRPTRTRPRATRWHRSEDMEFAVGSGGIPESVTVLLRRLANPQLPPDPRPASGGAANPLYNPYVTIDYVERIPVQNASDLTQSTGKLQPYASHPNRVEGQTAEQGGGTRHSLGEANGPRQPTFDWLVHLDRRLISPVELLSVSGFRPHELTHRFVTTPPDQGADFAHRVPWFDEDLKSVDPRASHRFYRLFEFLEARDRARPRGSVPGPININSVHDLDAFRALVGRRLEDRFGIDAVAAIWERVLRLRSPGLVGPTPDLTGADRPFLSTGVGILPASDPQANGRGVNIDDTILRAWDPGAPGDERRLFDVPGQDHPYLQKELLTGIYNRLETRSNTFAVWLTVGFFEVHDDSSLPVTLGPEVGQGGNAPVRHRFFAIVDRTNMQLFGQQSLTGRPVVTRYLTRSHSREGAVPEPGEQWVRLEILSGSTATAQRDATGAPTGRTLPWRIAPGSHLLIDTGRHREIVLVTDVDPARNAVQAVFAKAHDAAFEVSLPGNPGPQPGFDPRAHFFRDVVREAVRLE